MLTSSLLLPLGRGCRAWANRTCLLLAAAFLVPGAYARIAAGQEAPVTEYQLKAAFLYNFAKFVDWPATSFSGASGPFRLCIYGEEPFTGAREVLTGKRIKGRPVELRRVQSVAEAGECHMLFVGAADNDPGAPALAAVAGRTLTVGESADFAHHGGMINLVRVDNKIRFEIDRAAGERSGFRFSAQLLNLAILVGNRR